MENLNKLLPQLGHRNWIAVVDSAYPLQCRPGIETIVSNHDQLAEVRDALGAIDNAPHLRPEVLLDAELPFLSEADAPGIGAYRVALDRLLQGRTVRSLPHDKIIAQMDEVAQAFRVVIIKTRLTLPYTSVFIELHCGYWSPENERHLRAALPADFGEGVAK
jgi:hypothetical protein